MRTRDEVLRGFGFPLFTEKDIDAAIYSMADRIRELEQERHEDEGVVSVWRGRTERAEQRIRELEAHQAASEPVAYLLRRPDGSDYGIAYTDAKANAWRKESPGNIAQPVYAHPSAAGVKLSDLDHIRWWINAYTDPASGPHFRGHGIMIALLQEYLALRESLAFTAASAAAATVTEAMVERAAEALAKRNGYEGINSVGLRLRTELLDDARAALTAASEGASA